jgi:hypothetical protein
MNGENVKPLRVGRPPKRWSSMTDAERRAYAEEVVEALREDAD